MAKGKAKWWQKASAKQRCEAYGALIVVISIGLQLAFDEPIRELAAGQAEHRGYMRDQVLRNDMKLLDGYYRETAAGRNEAQAAARNDTTWVRSRDELPEITIAKATTSLIQPAMSLIGAVLVGVGALLPEKPSRFSVTPLMRRKARQRPRARAQHPS